MHDYEIMRDDQLNQEIIDVGNQLVEAEQRATKLRRYYEKLKEEMHYRGRQGSEITFYYQRGKSRL